MNDLNKYAFLGKVALAYRLSLFNLCRLMGLEPTEENQVLVYNSIIEAYVKDLDLVREYKYLFNYETLNEKDNASYLSMTKAALFIKKYNNAQKENDEATLKALIKSLNKTDSDFNALLKKEKSRPFSEEEMIIISKYRLKHALSKTTISSLMEIKRDRISFGESKIKNSIIKDKLNILQEYNLDMYSDVRKKIGK